MGALGVLEPDDGKLSSPVLRGLSGRKAARLPGKLESWSSSHQVTGFRGLIGQVELRSMCSSPPGQNAPGDEPYVSYLRSKLMKYYTVGEIEITDQSWVPAYVQNVTKLVEQRGGRYLARTSKIEKLEGEREVPRIFLIIEWVSKDAAMAFYESDEYRPYRLSRTKGSRNEFLLVPGEDMTKTAQIAN
jgi:uncharacterized protein (DUF1330 family)